MCSLRSEWLPALLTLLAMVVGVCAFVGLEVALNAWLPPREITVTVHFNQPIQVQLLHAKDGTP